MILGKPHRSFFAVFRRSEDCKSAPQLVAVVESYDAAIMQVAYRNELLSGEARLVNAPFYAGIVHSHSR